MGRKRPNPMPDNDVRMRTILAALVWCPYAGTYVNEQGIRGFQTRDIKRAAPTTFMQIFTSRSMAGKQVSTAIRMLAHRGYVTEIGRRKAVFVNPKASTEETYETEYQSPVYAITETGLTWVLTNCDLRHLIKVKHPSPEVSKYQRLTDLGADFDDPQIEAKFMRFARIDDWIAKPGWGESRYDFKMES